MKTYDFLRALRIALLCATKKMARPQLLGVMVGPDYIEGADGHRLVRVRLPGRLSRTGFATRLNAEVYVKRLKGEVTDLYNDFTGPPAEHLPLAEKSDYPDTSRIWDDLPRREAPAREVWLQPRYLATLKRIGKVLSPGATHSTRLSLGGPQEPVLFVMEAEDLGVELAVMPMQEPSRLRPGFDCEACGHQHQSERFAFICIGCPCPERKARHA